VLWIFFFSSLLFFRRDSRIYTEVKKVNDEFAEGQAMLTTDLGKRVAETFGPRLHQKTREAIFKLHASDPTTWTFEALATRYRIRADRAEAVYLLVKSQKEKEAKGSVFTGQLEAAVDAVCGVSKHLEGDRTSLEPVCLCLAVSASRSCTLYAAHPLAAGGGTHAHLC
jgi:hypothetical protein